MRVKKVEKESLARLRLRHTFRAECVNRKRPPGRNHITKLPKMIKMSNKGFGSNRVFGCGNISVGRSVSQWQFLPPTAAEHLYAAFVFFINSQKKETDKKYLGSLNISWPPLEVVLYFMNVCFIFSQLFFSWFLCSCLQSFQTSEFIHPHSDQERRWPKKYLNDYLPIPIILFSYFC